MTGTELSGIQGSGLAVTVDLAIFTVRSEQLQVLLIKRGKEPFRGMLALPGGYVRRDEGLDDAALRELSEETGVDGRMLHLEQLRAYGAPDRDPRGRVVTVAYLALGPDLPIPRAGTDAQAADWVPVAEVVEERVRLAFDHVVILREALERARAQLEYTTVAAAFCPEPFSVADLRHVYEAVWGLSLDPSNFRRKVTRAEGFMVATGESRSPEIGRPAMLYRRGASQVLFPPLLRSADFHPRDPGRSSGNEQVQVAADGRERLAADPAQVTADSLLGDGADLLRHGV